MHYPNNLLQLARDEADFIYNSAQNDLNRQNNLAIATLSAEAQARSGKEGGGSILGAAGATLGNIFASFAGTDKGSALIESGVKFLFS